MGVADEFQEVRLFLDHDGLVPVLEEMADPLMAAIEGAPHSGVRSERRLRASGREPVQTRRCA